jgi:hypothetical protein
MLRFITETWFVTTIFMLITGIVFFQGDKWEVPLALVGLAGVITPPVWWRIAARQPTPKQGALAGAICGGTIILLPSLLLSLVLVREGSDNLTSFVVGALLFFVVPAAMMIGSIIGVGTIYWRR